MCIFAKEIGEIVKDINEADGYKTIVGPIVQLLSIPLTLP
jgi:hypothetical protein